MTEIENLTLIQILPLGARYQRRPRMSGKRARAERVQARGRPQSGGREELLTDFTLRTYRVHPRLA